MKRSCYFISDLLANKLIMLLAKGNYICIILNPVPPKPRNLIPLLQFLFLCFNFVYSTVGVEIDILNIISSLGES